jgi:phenylacetate-CoA ligase
MKLIKSIYSLSPVWIQNWIISFYGYILYKQRYGGDYYKFFNFYKNKDYSNLQNEKKIQYEELIKILKHAKENSVFYKNFYKNYDLSQIKNINDIKKLPILEKETLRRSINDIYTVPVNESISSFTGGTTGKSLEVRFTKQDFQKRMAYLDAFKYKLGIDTFKTKKATFSGRSFISNSFFSKNKVFSRYNYAYNQKLFSTFDMTTQNLPYYIKELNEFKPEVLNGFVSALYNLAKYIELNNIKLEFTTKAIFTTSETLLPMHRGLIEKVFKSKIYNQYASAEGAPFITECLFGNLHYNIDTGVIEVVDTDDGKEILVTSFTTYGTPLIRYRIGDKVVFKEGLCDCGSSHPLVESIEGRKVDYLFSLERGKISLSHLADIIKGMPNSVINIQFIQENIHTIIINMMVDRSIYVENMDKSILSEMKLRFGNKMKFKIVKVDEIRKSKSGKFSFIINKLSDKGVSKYG